MNYMQNPLMPANMNSYTDNKDYGYASSYYPRAAQFYPQYQQSQYPQSSSDVHWVQGIPGAKAYPVEPGRSVVLMDSEANKFYIKSTDSTGMPQPLRCFRYTEEAEEVSTEHSGSVDMSQYMKRDDFEKLLDKKLAELRRGE